MKLQVIREAKQVDNSRIFRLVNTKTGQAIQVMADTLPEAMRLVDWDAKHVKVEGGNSTDV